MRKFAIAVALASTALASPALARDDSWYVGVEGGAMIVEDLQLDIGTLNDVGSINHDYGYDVGGLVGYDFGGFRTEVEVSYRKAASDQTAISRGGIPTGPTSAVSNGNFNTNGSTSALSFMLNGLLDFGDDDGIQGFVGGGVGVARTKVLNVLAAPAWLNDSDTGFAWQALAGVRAPLSGNWDAGLTYRLFNAGDADLVDRLGRAISTKMRSHSILGTLTYNFGGAEPVEETPMAPPPEVAPPPVVAPPPPQVVAPPAPPRVECNTGPYIVYFDHDKSNITSGAAETLDNAISAYRNCGNARIMLAGHADRSGNVQYNVALSQRRNKEVTAYMAARGVSTGVISAEAFGEGQPKVQTLDGVRNDQNRRVEITYGPGSGM
jgi:OmpA-OmpF porin, OOP family